MGQVGNKLQDYRLRPSLITLNVHGVNTPVKKQRSLRLDKKARPNQTAYKNSLNVNINSLKGWKKIYCANISQRKVRLAMLISKQISEQKLIRGINSSKEQYAPSSSKLHTAKTELQGGIYKSIIIVRDFNTPLSIIDKTSRQKISKDIRL